MHRVLKISCEKVKGKLSIRLLRKTSKVSQGQKRTTQDDLAQAVLDGDIHSVEQILDSFVALLGKR